MCARSLGHETMAGIVAQTDWGTEEELTPATDGILVLPGTVVTRNSPPYHIPESSQPWPRADVMITGPMRFTGTIAQKLRFDDLRLIALFLNNGDNYSLSAEQTPDQDDYIHTILPADDIEELFATFGMLHGTDVATWEGVKAQQLRIFGSSTGDDLAIGVELSVIVHEELWDSAIVLAAQFEDLAFLGDREHVVRFDQLDVRIGDHNDTTDLDGDDSIAVTAFDFIFKRNLSSIATSVSGRLIEEPKSEGQDRDMATLSLTFADFNVDSRVLNYIEDLKDGQHAMASLVFTGAQIGTGDNRSFAIYLPEIVVTDVGDTGSFNDAGPLPGSVRFSCADPGDELTAGGASKLSEQEIAYIEVTNNQAAKALA